MTPLAPVAKLDQRHRPVRCADLALVDDEGKRLWVVVMTGA